MKIAIALSTNIFHGNLTREKLNQINDDKLCFPILGESRIIFNILGHGRDIQLFPWYKETLKKYENLKLSSGLLDHVFLNRIHNEALINWQLKQGKKLIDNDTNLTFYPEYTIPHANHLSTHAPYYLILHNQSSLYVHEDNIVETDSIHDKRAIYFDQKYKNQKGFIMNGFQELNEKFFNWQRYFFSQEHLGSLIDTIIKIRNHSSNDVIIWPIDIESPYIGSFHGKDIWDKFCDVIHETELTDTFVSIENVITKYGPEAQLSKKPHRMMQKWFGHSLQLDHYDQISELNKNFPNPTKRELELLSLANVMDTMAAWHFQLSPHKRIFEAQQSKTTNSYLEIGYSQDVIEISLSAIEALQTKQKLSTLLKPENSFLKTELIEYAKKNNL